MCVPVCVCVSTNMSNAAFHQRQLSKCWRCINAVVVVAVAVGWICCVRFHCQILLFIHTTSQPCRFTYTNICRYDTTHNSHVHKHTHTYSPIHWSNATCVLYSLCILDVSPFISIVHYCTVLCVRVCVWLCVCIILTRQTNRIVSFVASPVNISPSTEPVGAEWCLLFIIFKYQKSFHCLGRV